MNNIIANRGKSITIIDILLIAIGCAMVPLWALGVYQSFKEGPIEIQGLVISSAALAVSICWVTATFLKRPAAIAALVFSTVFIVANFVYNTNSPNQLLTGLAFGLLFLLLSIIFFYSSTPHTRTQNASATTIAGGRPTWSFRTILVGLLFVFLFLVMFIGIYGLGYTF